MLSLIMITSPRCYYNPDVITTHFMDDCFVNLGEEVILTFLREYGASESATARMFCSDGSVLNDLFILNKSLM